MTVFSTLFQADVLVSDKLDHDAAPHTDKTGYMAMIGTEYSFPQHVL